MMEKDGIVELVFLQGVLREVGDIFFDRVKSYLIKLFRASWSMAHVSSSLMVG